ncbi:S1 family peptidase [Methanococcus sp. CF]
MIRKTLPKVKEATFCIELPNKSARGMPTPAGTGFFISPDGWFVTAAHVVTNENGSPRTDFTKSLLTKESNDNTKVTLCKYVTLKYLLPELDIALLKVDFEKNSDQEWLIGKTGFPFINISTAPLEMGEPVYSFGYPLSSYGVFESGHLGFIKLRPRVTSAIISSELETDSMILNENDPKHYVLDKALNYGNSGGPIISTKTGHVHAICSSFQPVTLNQPHLKDNNGKSMKIIIPSLYGIVSSFDNKNIINLLKFLNIPVEK